MTTPPSGDAVPPTPPAPPVPPPFVDPYAQPSPPPYAPAGYAPAYAPAYNGSQEPRGLAVASLVTGMIGAFFSLFYGFGFLPSLAAVITGHLARKRLPQARGMWLAGLICGYVGLGITLLWIILLVVLIVIGVTAAGADSGNFSELPA